MQQELTIELKKQSDVTLFDIKGDLTASSEPFLRGAYNDANNWDTQKILLQFYPDAYINSGGIAVLIQFLAETKKNNQQVSITGLSNHFKKIFNMVGITKFAKIYDSADEAIANLS